MRKEFLIGVVVLILLAFLVAFFVLMSDREGGDSNGQVDSVSKEVRSEPVQTIPGESAEQEREAPAQQAQEKTLIDTGGISLYNE